MQNTSSGGKFAIVAAIITALAGIITTIVSISGPLIDKKMAIEATQTKEALFAPAANISGAVMQLDHTATPAIPTAGIDQSTRAVLPTLDTAPTLTLEPQSTEGSPTEKSPDGAMLSVGESWTVNGLSVQLTDVEFPAGNEIHLLFAFTNESNKVINISLDHNRDVTLADDKGNEYKWASAFSWEVSIYPGTTRKDEIKRRGNVNRAEYFIITLEIPGVGSAKWKY